jgi:hypothetical protein
MTWNSSEPSFDSCWRCASIVGTTRAYEMLVEMVLVPMLQSASYRVSAASLLHWISG